MSPIIAGLNQRMRAVALRWTATDDGAALLLGQVVRAILLLRVVLGEIAADRSQPVGLNHAEVLIHVDVMLLVYREQIHVVAHVLALRIHADVPLGRVDA